MTTYLRYVALGDSSTEGLDDPDELGGFRGWADRLAARVTSTMLDALVGAGATTLTITTPDPTRIMPVSRPLRERLEDYNRRVRVSAARTGALVADAGTWRTALPGRQAQNLAQRSRAEAVWWREHFGPWLVRRARRQSSGDGVRAKRPKLQPVRAAVILQDRHR